MQIPYYLITKYRNLMWLDTGIEVMGNVVFRSVYELAKLYKYRNTLLPNRNLIGFDTGIMVLGNVVFERVYELAELCKYLITLLPKYRRAACQWYSNDELRL